MEAIKVMERAGLEDRISASCNIDNEEALRCFECEKDILRADLAEGGLTFEDIEDSLCGLGLDVMDDDIDYLLMSLM